MKFEFADAIPLVQQKKKQSTFKLTPIGGPDEIGKWREMQAAKEHVYRLRLVNRDDRIRQFEAETGERLDAPIITTADWNEKLSFANSERKRLAQLEKRVEEYPAWTPPPEPKKSLGDRFIQFFKNLWTNSNF